MIRSFELQRLTVGRAAAVLMAISLLAAASPSVEAQLPEYGFSLKVSEKENQIAHPDDPMWMKANMWDVSYQRMYERNMPTFELSNTSDPGMPDIMQFQLTIGDTRFHFSDQSLGVFALLGNTNSQDYVLTSSVADGGDRLIVNITNPVTGGGLAVGDEVRFKIKIGVDDGFNFFPHPDYRTVLFQMNGNQPYGPNPNIPSGGEKNAQASVLFDDGRLVGPATFNDETVTGAQSLFFNDSFRPYGIMEPVDIFEIGATFVIPEPTSAVLVLIGLLGGLGLVGRRRRGERAA